MLLGLGHHKNRVGGYSFLELSLLLGLFSLIILGLIGLMLDTGDEEYADIPPYRMVNAMYAHSLMAKTRIAVMSYYDLYGDLPGDGAFGARDGRIDKAEGEHLYVFPDLHKAGVLPEPIVRVRGRVLELYYADLKAGDQSIGRGHFFKLHSYDPVEALAMDRRHDDSLPNSGDIVYSRNDDGTVDLYMKLNLYD